MHTVDVQLALGVTRLSILSLVTLSSACSPQTVIVLEADTNSVNRAHQLEVGVCDQEGNVRLRRSELVTVDFFPLRLPVTPVGEDRSRVFALTASLNALDGEVLQIQRAISSFPERGNRTVVRRFEAPCEEVLDCFEHQTCNGGICIDAREEGVDISLERASSIASCRQPEADLVIPPEPCVICSAAGAVDDLHDVDIEPSRGLFTFEFHAVPTGSDIDAKVWLSAGPAADDGATAIELVFTSAGFLGVQSGTGPDGSPGDDILSGEMPYDASRRYQFRLEVDVEAHTFDVFVSQHGETERELGTNLLFMRSGRTVDELNHVGISCSPDSSIFVLHPEGSTAECI